MIRRKTKNFFVNSNRNSRWIGPDLHTGRESIKNCPKSLMLALSFFLIQIILFRIHQRRLLFVPVNMFDDVTTVAAETDGSHRPLYLLPTDAIEFTSSLNAEAFLLYNTRPLPISVLFLWTRKAFRTDFHFSEKACRVREKYRLVTLDETLQALTFITRLGCSPLVGCCKQCASKSYATQMLVLIYQKRRTYDQFVFFEDFRFKTLTNVHTHFSDIINFINFI